MKRVLALGTVLICVLAVGSAFGVSDGNYDPARLHCSGYANSYATPARVEDGCHNFTFTVSDAAGHEYFGIGTQQTGEGEPGLIPPELPFGLFAGVHALDVWYDVGDGCTRYTIDLAAPGPPVETACPWFDPAAPNFYGPSPEPDPSSGFKIYFGADDNLAGGEHDSSYLINNGPSDGGAVRLEFDPASIEAWIAALQAQDSQFLLTHPLPVGEAGAGFCADSICLAVQSERQVAYQGGKTDGTHRSLANYAGKEWDPESCSGPHDPEPEGKDCDDPSTPEDEDITYWHNKEGTVYAEPGIQIFADPDPQGSPIGPYPLPALYVGTCGLIIGGGPAAQMPAGPLTNSAGQIVIETGCE